MPEMEQLFRIASLLAEKYELRARSWLVRHGINVDFFVENVDILKSKRPQDTITIRVRIIAEPPWDRIIENYIERNVLKELERIESSAKKN